MGFVFKEGRDLVGFEITLFNVPGSLSSATSVFKNHGINIVFIEMFPIGKGEGLLFVVGDFTGVDIDSNVIVEELKGFEEYIKDVNIAPSVGDIVYSSNIVIKDIGGVRVILWSKDSMIGFVEGIRERLGEGGLHLLQHLGHGVGTKIYEYHIQRAGVSSAEDVINVLNAVISGHRWGKIIHSERDDNKLCIRIFRLWECEVLKGKVDKPASNFFKGVLTGLFSAFYGKEVIVREAKCIALNDPYCEYIIEAV